MSLGLLVSGLVILLAFLVAVFVTRSWIRVAQRTGIVGIDMNKSGNRKVAEAGGVAFISAFSFSLLMFVFTKTFILGTDNNLVGTLIILNCMMLAGFIGFTDDVLGWKKGLRKLHKPLLTIPVAIPLVVINAGDSVLQLPFIGSVDFGLIYPLLIVPAAVVGASNGFNMLAGYNGIEASIGALILSALGLKLLFIGNLWLAYVCFAAVMALLGFLVYNSYPAKIFPGDTLTYSVGALIAVVAIMGGLQKMAVILFIPYFIELVLKLRKRFNVETFGVVQADGTLKAKDAKSCSIFHVILNFFPKFFKRNPKEYEAVLVVIALELVLMSIAFMAT